MKTFLVLALIFSSPISFANNSVEYRCNEGALGEHTPTAMIWSESSVVLDSEVGTRTSHAGYEYSFAGQYFVVLKGNFGDNTISLDVYDGSYGELVKSMNCGR